jgi:biopolymer transport protein ExbB/TolQ
MESQGFIGGIVYAFQISPYTVTPIFICFSVAVAFVIERYITLFTKLNIDGASFMFEIQKYVLANDLDGAIRICNGASQAALPKVIKSGLQRASRDEQQIQNAIDAATLEVAPKVERRLGYLALIANIATLLGLLGTITGLIKAFQAIGLADPAKRQQILANGISEAMNATALGLVTAIFAMIMHSILANRAQKIIDEIDEFGVKLIDLLSARKYRHSSEKVD